MYSYSLGQSSYPPLPLSRQNPSLGSLFSRPTRSTISKRRRFVRAGFFFVLAIGVAAGISSLARFHRGPSRNPISTAVVRRTSLESEIVETGLVKSSRSTEIRCKLERLRPQVQGALGVGGLLPTNRTSTVAVDEGDASAIISLAPE